MGNFVITLNERGGYNGTLRKECIDADDFKITEGENDLDSCVNQCGDLILIKDDTVIGTYKADRWLDIKLVPGKKEKDGYF